MASPGFKGGRLAEAREAAGLTHEQLAAAVGVFGALRARLWERGAEQPRPSLIPLLAHVVQVDPLELLDVDRGDPPLGALRLAAGLSSRQMGAAAAMSVMSYHRLENGIGRAAPGERTVVAVADALNVSVERVEAAIRRTRDDHNT